MDTFFVKLFNMGVAAGWMILAVLLFRLLLKKVPHWIHCLLWGFVAIRLICPVSFQSVLSLIPSTETIQMEGVHYGEQLSIQSGIPAVNKAVNPVIENTLVATLPPGVTTSVNPMAVWMHVAGVVWLAGAAVLLLFAVVSYVRLHRRVRFAARLSGNAWQCDEIQAPFILGIFRPRIYLPSGIDGASMNYVLAHERAHLKRFDHWWKPLSYVLLAAYWFHPLVWVAYVLFCRDIELACDEKVIRAYDMDEKKAYSGALLAMSMNRRQAMVCPLAFCEVGVKERVKSVLHYKKPAFWILAAALVACVAVAVCFLTDPKAATDTEDAAMDDSENGREKHAMLTYILDEPHEMPVTLYEGDGFSIYVPDEDGVLIYDKTLEAPGRLSVVWGHSIFIEVMCYEGKTIAYVEEELERNGYAYDAVYDSGGKKMQKEEDYRLLSEARLYSSGGDVWVVCTTHASAYDLGSQLDAIADTLQITGDVRMSRHVGRE